MASPVTSGISVVSPMGNSRLVSEDGVQSVGSGSRVVEVRAPCVHSFLTGRIPCHFRAKSANELSIGTCLEGL